MRKQKPRNWKRGLVITAIVLASLAIVGFISFRLMDRNLYVPQTMGATLSRPYAESLGLNPDEALTASLDDLKIRRFRIPAYWSLLEPQQGKWDWTNLDKDVNAIGARQGKIVMAVGQKLPRWPECWIPDWAMGLDQGSRENELKNYLTETVNRYRDNPAISTWQVENEPGFPFGTCPSIRSGLFEEEIALVRKLDPTRPIASTDSGELALWTMGRHVDQLGFSVYRVVVSPIGIWRYWFVPPQFYFRKAQLLSWFIRGLHVYVSEFQMEPWVDPSITQTSIDEQMKTMSLQQMQDNIAFAKRSGLSTIDYWGVEWWYWMKTVKNHPEFWELAKTIYQ